VLVSDLYDPGGFERGINALRFEGFEPYVVHMRDERDGSPPLGGDVLVYDCETGDEREVTITPAVLEKLGTAYQEYSARIERFCKEKQVPYLAADAKTPFDQIVLRAFRQGGFIR
jgi:hypothetical protein